MARAKKRKPNRAHAMSHAKVQRPTVTRTMRVKRPKSKTGRASRGRPGLVGSTQQSSYLPSKKTHILDNTVPRAEYHVDKQGFIQPMSRGPASGAAPPRAFQEVEWILD